jgi:bifunctional DNase/RNase
MSISKAGFVVLLKSQQDDRTLPIYIGPPEAQAILFKLNKVTLPRPMTHDLMKNMLDVLEARLEMVHVHDLKDGIFHARLTLAFEGQSLEVDSRPSDAIALALRCNAPIFVADKVMDEDAIVLADEEHEADVAAPGPSGSAGDDSAEKASDDPSANLKRQLAKAVSEERYEDAARLRDEIQRAGSSN